MHRRKFSYVDGTAQPQTGTHRVVASFAQRLVLGEAIPFVAATLTDITVQNIQIVGARFLSGQWRVPDPAACHYRPKRVDVGRQGGTFTH